MFDRRPVDCFLTPTPLPPRKNVVQRVKTLRHPPLSSATWYQVLGIWSGTGLRLAVALAQFLTELRFTATAAAAGGHVRHVRLAATCFLCSPHFFRRRQKTMWRQKNVGVFFAGGELTILRTLFFCLFEVRGASKLTLSSDFQAYINAYVNYRKSLTPAAPTPGMASGDSPPRLPTVATRLLPQHAPEP